MKKGLKSYNTDMGLSEKNTYRVFIFGLIIKGLNALLEIIGGGLFLLTGGATSLLMFLIRGELIEDPGDFIAGQIQHLIPYFSSHAQLYISFYLISHGVIKIFLVISLLAKRLWAYPVAIIVFFAFIVYQIYRLSYGLSWFLIILTIFDILIVALTWYEFKIVKKQKVL